MTLGTGSGAGSGELHRTAADWETLAAANPYWAVLVDPKYKDAQWPIDAFLESGREDWAKQRKWLGQRGLVASGARALDFGCGVGRMTLALTESFETVVGVDISPTMLETAKTLAAENGRCTFVLNETPDLHIVDDLGPFDFVQSVIVLQHVPAALIPGYISEFVRVLRPGGILTFQLPERPVISVKGLALRFLPIALLGLVQRRFLKYPAPMRMSGLRLSRVTSILRDAGATVIATEPDDSYQGYWHSIRYIAVRDVNPE